MNGIVSNAPYHIRSIQNRRSHDDGQEESRNKAQNGVRPGEAHDAYTDVLGQEKHGNLIAKRA